MLFWNIGLVDTFSVLKLCINCGSQYMSIVGTAAIGNSSDLGIKTLLEPVLGLGTSYQFVKAAATTAERRQRIATLASFLAASATSVTTDPNTNIAIGAAVRNKIGYMRAILARGGGSQHILNPSLKDFTIIADSVKTPVLEIHPYRTQFTYNSKMIIDNMFQEHTARLYLQGSAQKIKTVARTYLSLRSAGLKGLLGASETVFDSISFAREVGSLTSLRTALDRFGSFCGK